MQEFSPLTPTPQHLEPESVRRLLEALAEWGMAEVNGVEPPALDALVERAMSAYKDVAAVA